MLNYFLLVCLLIARFFPLSRQDSGKDVFRVEFSLCRKEYIDNHVNCQKENSRLNPAR
ncbi:MAG TPA: hypothetical protein DEB17_02175 [Chlorobaculum sp.]|uniref:Uncharacterized protein n=1 Tax=Chlorobaculum tepidum (strain ATCC 49652 / DSM 12025 / NBRC 103806 / TLS) TaxID=194439 RepID=Q8KEL7_CHLTE|nr:hypothetical protein CT0671 [Chlorobaculum tepidum TLS]HBU22805.1 hypothetical protein [Chlorobaculum sp.]